MNIAKKVKEFMKCKKGEGTFTDVVIVILIVAIVGAVVLFVLRGVMPDLVQGVMDNIQEGIDGVDLFNGLG